MEDLIIPSNGRPYYTLKRKTLLYNGILTFIHPQTEEKLKRNNHTGDLKDLLLPASLRDAEKRQLFERQLEHVPLSPRVP
jgi:hypothetical protein